MLTLPFVIFCRQFAYTGIDKYFCEVKVADQIDIPPGDGKCSPLALMYVSAGILPLQEN